MLEPVKGMQSKKQEKRKISLRLTYYNEQSLVSGVDWSVMEVEMGQ